MIQKPLDREWVGYTVQNVAVKSKVSAVPQPRPS